MKVSKSVSSTKTILLVASITMLTIGTCGGALILRLYFIHGGSRLWLSSALQSAGWPILFIPLAAAYVYRRWTEGPEAKLVTMKPFLFFSSIVIGCLLGVDNFFSSYASSKLPVSTSMLIAATQLVFTSIFSFLLVRQRFTPYSVNTIVLLTTGSALLALRSGSDRPEGESGKDYAIGFVMALSCVALYGLILPLIQLSYTKAKQPVTFTLLLEMQMVSAFFSSAFCIGGMLIHNDFQAIPGEAKEFDLGETKYYLVLLFTVILWQTTLLGAIGVVFTSSSLLSGILSACMIPIIDILGVVLFHESFKAEKIVALLLSVWGFVSYYFGEMKQSKNKNQDTNGDTLVKPLEEETKVVVAP